MSVRTLLLLAPPAALLAYAVWRLRRKAPAFDAAAVGTTNACKLSAVRKAIAAYPEVCGAVSAHKVASNVSEQPMTLDETTRGAKNRAEAAAAAACAEKKASDASMRVLGIGIESGLFALDGKYFDVCVVAAYDGRHHHIGLSCAFEIPPTILTHVLDGGADLSQACNRSGITNDPKLGEHGGLIGLLSSGRLTREAYTVQALNTALFFAAEGGRDWYRVE